MQSAYGHPSQAVRSSRYDAMSTDGASDFPPSPSRRAHYQHADYHESRRPENYSYRDDGAHRSYGAALGSMPDRQVVSSNRPRTAPFVDRSPRGYTNGRDYDQAYDQSAIYNTATVKSPSRQYGATALLQQHAANQWAFRANQTNLPAAAPSAPSVLQPATRTTYPPPSAGIAHAGNDVSSQGSHDSPARAPRTVAYTPYSYSSVPPSSRPALNHREQSSSGSSTSASTTPGTSQASFSGRSNGNGLIDGSNGNHHARSTSSSGQLSSNADFSRMFFDPLRIKQRRRTSPAQLRVLEHHFDRSPKPDLALRKRLASELEMTPREVQVWFQNRRAKVKKLAERAERAERTSGGQASSSTRADAVDHESDEQMAGGDDDGDDDDEDSASRSRMRTASAPSSSSRHGLRVPRYPSNGSSAQYDSESAELPDPSAYASSSRGDPYGAPMQQQQPSLAIDELRLPLPPNPNDYYEPVGPSASGRRYSLPAFASSVIPPTPYDENGSAIPGHSQSRQDPYSPTFFVPSSASALGGFRQRPATRSPGIASSQPNEHSPAQSASSRASEAIPMAIPENAEVSSWDAAATSAPTHPSSGYATFRRSSAPPQAFPMYEGDNVAVSRCSGEPFVVTSGSNGVEPGLAYNPAVYPPPVSMIDPVASVAFLHDPAQDPPATYSYAYVQPSATMQDTPVSTIEAPLYVTAEELDGSAGQ